MAYVGHIVLLHAFPLSAELWQPLREPLEPWTLVTPDLPGFGRSAEKPAASMEEIARHVLGVLDEAAIDRAVIGGMSMGGYATFALYRMAPERFAGMVLVDTRATADSGQQREGREKMIATVREKGPSAVADEMVPKLLGETSRRERRELAVSVRRMIETNSPEAIAGALEAMRDRPDSTPLLSRISVPTLIVCGEEDGLTPPADSEALHAAIPGSRLVLLPGAGHLSAYEVPEAFARAARRFLESSDAFPA